MSRSTERLLQNFFGLYTTHIGHRKRHIDSFRFSSLCKRQNTVPEGKVRRDPFHFHSSSEKTYGRWGIADGTLKVTERKYVEVDGATSTQVFWALYHQTRPQETSHWRFSIFESSQTSKYCSRGKSPWGSLLRFRKNGFAKFLMGQMAWPFPVEVALPQNPHEHLWGHVLCFGFVTALIRNKLQRRGAHWDILDDLLVATKEPSVTFFSQ